MGHDLLNVIGFGFDPADIVNGIWYAAEGDYVNAAYSGAAMLPIFGSFGKGLKLWSETASQFAVTNKLHHIFDFAKHSFDPLLAEFGGSQIKAFRALEVATQESVTASRTTGIFENIVVNVKGIDVTVSGNVVNGQARIGTAFIK